MLALLLLQTSLLVQPLYLSEAPPPLRSARSFLLAHAGAERVAEPTTRSKEEAQAFARDLLARLRAGADLQAVLAQAQVPGGDVLGTFAPGMLAPELDRFLFSAAVGEYSDPLPTPGGIRVLQRIETHAAVLQILAAAAADDPAARAAARARAEGWLARVRAGEDFGELASEVSEHEPSKKRGGQFAIYERGTRDLLLKRAAFELAVGETAGPIESPVGWHLIRRVPVAEVDPALAEDNFIRLRAILLQHEDLRGVDRASARTQAQAKSLAGDIVRRLDAGEELAALAREFDDDPGGRERGGDLGWIHRSAPELFPVLREAFYLRVGERLPPRPTPLGWLILRRER